MIERIFYIGLGSGIGGIFRYLMSVSIYHVLGKYFPYGTLFVNALGSFLIGFLFIILLPRMDDPNNHLPAFVLVGLLGGFTTFSSFSLESINLLEEGKVTLFLINILASVGICISLTWLGILLGREL